MQPYDIARGPAWWMTLASWCSLAACCAAAEPGGNADPLAAWRAGVTISRVTDEERHSIHTYFNASPESPDGRWVLYYSSSDPRGEAGDIRIIERATGEVRVLARDVATEDAHRAACQQWAGGGRFVVFHNVLDDGQWVVCRVDVASGDVTTLARDRQLGIGQPQHTMAPLYGKHWNPGEHRDLELLDVETGDIRRTSLTAQAIRAQYADWVERQFGARPISIFIPMLSPDATRVFCKLATPAGGDFRSGKASDRHGLVCYDLRDSRFLFMQPDWGHPAWHPDSRHVLNVGGRMTDSDTGNVSRIANPPRLPGSHPSMSPDGRLFVSDALLEATQLGGQPWSVGVGDIRSGEFLVLDTFDNSQGARSWRASHPHPVMSADGRRIYFNVSRDRYTRLHVAEVKARSRGAPTRGPRTGR